METYLLSFSGEDVRDLEESLWLDTLPQEEISLDVPEHEWIVLWDDGERSCCHCAITGEERIFEHPVQQESWVCRVWVKGKLSMWVFDSETRPTVESVSIEGEFEPDEIEVFAGPISADEAHDMLGEFDDEGHRLWLPPTCPHCGTGILLRDSDDTNVFEVCSDCGFRR